MNVNQFARMHKDKQKITMITCYTAWAAKIIDQTAIDCVLVGDSAAMVIHGYDSTVPATVDMMLSHVRAVVKGAPSKFIIADMPFLSYRKGLQYAMDTVQQFMQAGAHAIKLEGVEGHLDLVEHIVKSGVPVMGHIGLTPQSVNQLGGYVVQGKQQESQQKLILQAKQLQKAGCFAVVLECIPSVLAKQITESLDIPTIGIGAGVQTSGQVLVLQDMLGMDDQFKPKFCKQYLQGFDLIKSAVEDYVAEVKDQQFPCEQQHTYAVGE